MNETEQLVRQIRVLKLVIDCLDEPGRAHGQRVWRGGRNGCRKAKISIIQVYPQNEQGLSDALGRFLFSRVKARLFDALRLGIAPSRQ